MKSGWEQLEAIKKRATVIASRRPEAGGFGASSGVQVQGSAVVAVWSVVLHH